MSTPASVPTRREYTEQVVERILVGSFQKPFHDLALMPIRHCLPSFPRFAFCGCLANSHFEGLAPGKNH
jgi:hypothetical protein